MTNSPSRDPTPPRAPIRASGGRSQFAIAIVAVVLVVGAVLYFSAASERRDPDVSGTAPATTEPAPASNAPADNNGTTTP